MESTRAVFDGPKSRPGLGVIDINAIMLADSVSDAVATVVYQTIKPHGRIVSPDAWKLACEIAKDAHEKVLINLKPVHAV